MRFIRDCCAYIALSNLRMLSPYPVHLPRPAQFTCLRLDKHTTICRAIQRMAKSFAASTCMVSTPAPPRLFLAERPRELRVTVDLPPIFISKQLAPLRP